ncbi:MAG TPA: YajQ family cyclic di-GMP-binding protein [Verrucomicrobiae bacterium]|nr:YajQ family cyclic di-GMP-binding protein [Verrucomicrobiae bacterium]
MPSFDAAAGVDLAEVRNAINQARRELGSRFDFRNVAWEIVEEKDQLVISAQDEFKLRAVYDILTAKLAGRSVSLKNIDPQPAEISSVGRARQVIKLKQGLDTPVAKDIVARIKDLDLKVQAQIMEGKVRVTGKKKDDLQTVIAFLRKEDLPVGLNFENFRD